MWEEIYYCFSLHTLQTIYLLNQHYWTWNEQLTLSYSDFQSFRKSEEHFWHQPKCHGLYINHDLPIGLKKCSPILRNEWRPIFDPSWEAWRTNRHWIVRVCFMWYPMTAIKPLPPLSAARFWSVRHRPISSDKLGPLHERNSSVELLITDWIISTSNLTFSRIFRSMHNVHQISHENKCGKHTRQIGL